MTHSWQCSFSGFEVLTRCKALSISPFGSEHQQLCLGWWGPQSVWRGGRNRWPRVTPEDSTTTTASSSQSFTTGWRRARQHNFAQPCFQLELKKKVSNVNPIIWVLRRKSFSIFEEESFGGSAFIPDPVSGRVESWECPLLMKNDSLVSRVLLAGLSSAAKNVHNLVIRMAAAEAACSMHFRFPKQNCSFSVGCD